MSETNRAKERAHCIWLTEYLRAEHLESGSTLDDSYEMGKRRGFDMVLRILQESKISEDTNE